jgi:hypothetical protein
MKRILRRVFDKISPNSQIKMLREEIQELRYDLHALAALAFNAVSEKSPRYQDPKRLLRHAAQVCSQSGEDGVIHEIFRRVKCTDRVFAEVGVGDGSENNTAFLLSQGWRGFWVDGDDAFLRNIEKRPDLRGGCLRGITAFVTKENIASIFAQLQIPAQFDLLSLDIDQNTYYLWEGLSSYRPRVVVVEYNGTIPPDIEWKVNYAPDRTWDRSHNFGASLKSFELLGRRLGYSLVGCDILGADAYFVRDDIVADHFAPPYTAENHYEPPRYSLHHRRGHLPSILDRAGDA